MLSSSVVRNPYIIRIFKLLCRRTKKVWNWARVFCGLGDGSSFYVLSIKTTFYHYIIHFCTAPSVLAATTTKKSSKGAARCTTKSCLHHPWRKLSMFNGKWICVNRTLAKRTTTTGKTDPKWTHKTRKDAGKKYDDNDDTAWMTLNAFNCDIYCAISKSDSILEMPTFVAHHLAHVAHAKTNEIEIQWKEICFARCSVSVELNLHHFFFSSLCPIQIAIVLKSRYLNAMTSTLSLSFLCSLFLPRLKRVFPLPPFQLSVAFANSIVKQYKKKPRCAIVNRFDFIGVWCCSRVFFATIL